jgi:hypothetical protein
LGGGLLTFSNSKEAVASLLCALFPLWPVSSDDNQCHLQALRHLYVTAAECRLVVPCDVETRRPCFVPIRIATADGTVIAGTAPITIPAEVALVAVDGPRYWPIALTPRSKLWLVRAGSSPKSSPFVVFVKRKAGFLQYADDPKGVRGIESEAFPASSWISGPQSPLLDNTAVLRAFSSSPKIHAFAKLLCCDDGGDGGDRMAAFFSRALLECVAGERGDLLPVFLGLWHSALSSPASLVNSEALDNVLIVVSSTRSELMDPLLLQLAAARLRSLILDDKEIRLLLSEYAAAGVFKRQSARLSAAIRFLGVPSACVLAKVLAEERHPRPGKIIQILQKHLHTATASTTILTLANILTAR